MASTIAVSLNEPIEVTCLNMQSLDASVFCLKLGSCFFPAAYLNVGLLSQVSGIHLLSYQPNAPQLLLQSDCWVKQTKLLQHDRCVTVTEVVLSVIWLFRAHCKPWGRGTHRAACHLSPGGDGFVQQQAQIEAGPPQPGNRRTHVTPHTGRRNLKWEYKHTFLNTLWNTGNTWVHPQVVQSHQTLQCQ